MEKEKTKAQAANTEAQNTTEVEEQKKAADVLMEQQRKDVLLEQERMRKWIEDDEPLPVKMACKLSQHIVAKDSQ